MLQFCGIEDGMDLIEKALNRASRNEPVGLIAISGRHLPLPSAQMPDRPPAQPPASPLSPLTTAAQATPFSVRSCHRAVFSPLFVGLSTSVVVAASADHCLLQGYRAGHCYANERTTMLKVNGTHRLRFLNHLCFCSNIRQNDNDISSS